MKKLALTLLGICATLSFSYSQCATLKTPFARLYGESFEGDTINGESVKICSSGSFALRTDEPIDSLGESITWQVLSGNQDFISDQNDAVIALNPVGGEDVEIQLTFTDSCGEDTSILFEIQAITPPNSDFTLSSVDTCEGADIELTLINKGPEDNILWQVFSGDGTMISPSSQTTTFTSSSVGTHTVGVTVTSTTCPLSNLQRDVVMESNQTPSITIDSQIDSVFCPDINIQYSTTSEHAGNNPTYSWYVNDNEQEDSTSLFESEDLFAGDIELIVVLTSSLRCTDPSQARDTVNFSIMDRIEPTVTVQNLESCESTTVIANATVGSLQWYKNGTQLPGQTSSSLTTTTSGNYYFSESNGPCPASFSDTTVVTILESPLVNAGPDQLITDTSTTVVLSGSASEGTAEWTQLAGETIENLDDISIVQTFKLPEFGIYTFVLSADNGDCISSDEVTINASAVGVKGRIINDANIFPNPSTGNITINETGSWNASVLDFQGRQIKKMQSTGSHNVDLDVHPGHYTIIVQTKTETKVAPIIIK